MSRCLYCGKWFPDDLPTEHCSNYCWNADAAYGSAPGLAHPITKEEWELLVKADKFDNINGIRNFISFLANRLPADGLTKAQIIRMADRLTHGGTWDGEKVVLDVRTPLEMAQARILELEAEVERENHIRLEAESSLWRVYPNTHTVPCEFNGYVQPDPFEGPGETYQAAYQRNQDKLDALTALLTEYGVLPLAQRSDLAPPVALNYEQVCRIAEVLR